MSIIDSKSLPTLPEKLTGVKKGVDQCISSHVNNYKNARQSKYHSKCNGLHDNVKVPSQLDKKYRDKLSEIKRLMLHLKMQNTPLEVTYYHRKSQSNDPNSKIPKPLFWRPVSPYRPTVSGEKRTHTRSRTPSTVKKGDDEVSAFIPSLIPLITPLSPEPLSCGEPYRSKFNHEYDLAYEELLKKLPRKIHQKIRETMRKN
ncbi:hypothetical protein HDV02_000266 [Globomyces sp. JEL0801]|nr:hypothetical protein HDV02_000266 [Globomyces sp. JEL0801]